MTLIPNQPYPDKDGWEDISQYLVNGWEPFAGQSALARVVGNSVEFAARLRGSRATNFVFFRGFPDGMRPVMNFGFVAPSDKGVLDVLFTTAGLAHLTEASLARIDATLSGPFPGSLQFYGVLPRAGAQ